jgi:galactose mutarotase-like enzyme
MPASTAETTWEGEPGITLRAGELSATFLPDVGMTGVSLQLRGTEYLAVPGGVAALRAGSTGGLPLLAPWANRLAGWQYAVAGIDVDLDGLDLGTDDNGLPIHGLLVGREGWRVTDHSARGDEAHLTASIGVDSAAFPFPHRIDLAVTAGGGALTVDTTVVPAARRPVPIAFGWHPYFRLPSRPRANWDLVLPARRHLTLDDRGIPTGSEEPEAEEAAPIGDRTFDDLYALGEDHRLALRADDGSAIELQSDAAYPFAQVWVPEGRDFAALEPMTSPTNSLATGSAPVVQPGEAYTARFTLTFR